MTDNWYFNIEKKMVLQMQLCSLILKKTFDTIEHEILRSKLELYGFRGSTLNLLRNYLSGTTQVTTVAHKGHAAHKKWVRITTSEIKCSKRTGNI